MLDIVSKVVSIDAVVKEILSFLKVPTPDSWVQYAVCNIEILLLDHANCEFKAASSGMSLIAKYRDKPLLQHLMTRLVREEMLHYEQVLIFMDKLEIQYRPLTASRYVKTLRESIRTSDEEKLVDLLVVGAVVEARSCERFAALWPHLPLKLGQYYKSLLRSEGRHYQDYLALARTMTTATEIDERLALFLKVDRQLIESPDHEFRFHSGIPSPRCHSSSIPMPSGLSKDSCSF